ncbi:hypothetical protein C1H76_1095 [Elsinoe australis]|uniref:Uncharacterized protein n=1 Tax=Elsinoe australis TaxID=40998 RepID=A0A4U7B596_9PEZI|nr:hypothetical protein C1H76_1095 [Elsinoe australis]
MSHLHHHIPQDENLAPYQPLKPQHHPHTVSHSPSRQPLTSLQPNISSPRKSQPLQGQKRASSTPHARSPLKRTSISVLDSDKGLTYLKRRKLSLGSSSSSAPAQAPALYAEVPAPAPVPDSRVHAAAAAATAAATGQGHAGPTPTRDKNKERRHITPAARELLEEQSSDEEDGNSEEGSTRSFTSLINYDPSSQTSGATPRVGMSGGWGRTPGKALKTPVSNAMPGRGYGGQGFAQGGSQGQGYGGQSQGARRRGYGEVRADRREAGRGAETRAETLRLRLRVAVYKVMTGQTYVPFQRLRLFRAPEGMGRTRGIEAGGGGRRESSGSSGEETVVVGGEE